MLRAQTILVLIFSFFVVNSYAQNIEKHQWRNRILIVKTQNTTSKKYQKQLKEFVNANDELIERKLILYKITKNDFTLANFENSKWNDSGKLSKGFADSILNKQEDFEIILIGLDGQTKLQQSEVLTKEELFKTIDVMPMRRHEIRN
ncbi:DUF4174 domain-containing protein [Aquimarina spongiae]|uniref:DUF4174 domain-containing protein n=1 Tax=Aquimarina spongiae TaxID=570521 RepID=A0A1M6I0Z3_9FLAO|nr:DUF4174 domain-containing protein [Aquimarina spongiae]SHJ28152.1 protein of unknown function [Aquimarina spongiae]